MTEPENVSAKRGRSKRPLVIGAVIVAVIVASLGTWWGFTVGSAAVREKQIRETVTAYYTAVAEADADKAMSMATTPVEPGDLLTDEVLTSSAQQAPLTEIEVTTITTADPFDRATAEVSYKIGEAEVTGAVPLTHTPQGWRLDQVTSDLTLASTNTLTVNGARVSSTMLKVLPGTYTAESASKFVDLDGVANATVLKAGESGAAIAAKPQLSKLGVDTVTNLAKQSLNTCLAAKISNPPNCPWEMTENDSKVKKGSVVFKLTNDPWKGFTPTLSPDFLTAVGNTQIKIKATAYVELSDRGGLVSSQLDVDTPIWVDLTVDPPVLVWAK